MKPLVVLTIIAVIAILIFVLRNRGSALEQFSGDTEYLGTMPDLSNNPIMREAVEQARKELPSFLSLYPTHQETSMVRFRYRRESGKTANLWGRIVEWRQDTAILRAIVPPAFNDPELDRELEINLDELTDWEVLHSDGTLIGGYTKRARSKIVADSSNSQG
jgi:uncharacterized protein YegJ (DUF2314 family)